MLPAEENAWCAQHQHRIFIHTKLALLVVGYTESFILESDFINIQQGFFGNLVVDKVEHISKDASLRVHRFQPRLALLVLLNLR